MGMCEESLKQLADSIEGITGEATMPVPVCLFPLEPSRDRSAAALYLVHLQEQLAKAARLVGVQEIFVALPEGSSGEEVLGVVEEWLDVRSRYLMHIRLTGEVAHVFMRAVQYMMETRFLIKSGKISP